MNRVAKPRPRVSLDSRWHVLGALLAALVLLMGLSYRAVAAEGPLSAAARFRYDRGPRGRLMLFVWGARRGEQRPALVLFHGGGWKSGSAAQFGQMCSDLARRSIVCVSVNYSLSGGERVEAEAKNAISWVRRHAPQFGIDPKRVFVGGGSAGGYLALSTAVIARKPLSMPDGLVLLNPVFGAVGIGPTDDLEADLSAALPPTVIFHGTADQAVPYSRVLAFVSAAESVGSHIYLETFPGRRHGFFNYSRYGNPDYDRVTNKIIGFIRNNGEE